MIEPNTVTPLSTLVVDATNFSITSQYTGIAMTMGPSQPVLNSKNEIVGTTPQWSVTAQWSPQALVQLHALLGHTIEAYERQFGRIPRLAVPFEARGAPAEGEASNVVTMSGAAVPESATRPSDPPPPVVVPAGYGDMDRDAPVQSTHCGVCGETAAHLPWCAHAPPPNRCILCGQSGRHATNCPNR